MKENNNKIVMEKSENKRIKMKLESKDKYA